MRVMTAEGVRFDGVRFTETGGSMNRAVKQLRPTSLFVLPDGAGWLAMEGAGPIRWKERVWNTARPALNEGGITEVSQVTPGPEGAVLIVRSGEVYQATGEAPA